MTSSRYLITGILSLLLTVTSVSQTANWTENWIRMASGNDIGIDYGISTNKQNEVVAITYYFDTVSLGDTAFYHDNWSGNWAISKMDPGGKIVKALDVFTGFDKKILELGCVIDQEHNVYVAGDLADPVYVADSVLHTGFQFNPGLTDIFIVKLDPDFKMVWSRIITGQGYDRLNSLCLAGNHLYFSTNHSTYNHYTAIIDYFGQDTAKVPGVMTDLVKMDLDGNLEWVKKIRVVSNYFDLGKLKVRNSNHLMLYGSSTGDVSIDGQIIHHTIPTYTQCPLIIEVDTSGTVEYAGILPLKMGLSDAAFSVSGDLILAGYFASMTIGNKTITFPPGKTGAFIGRLDQNLEPKWYKIVEFYKDNTFFDNIFNLVDRADTVFFSINLPNLTLLDSAVIFAGGTRECLLGSISPEGVLLHTYLTKSTYDAAVTDLEMDNCGNLLLGGHFTGDFIFGNDTVSTPSFDKLYGYTAKIERYAPPVIDLGNDTTLLTGETLVLTLPGYFHHFLWSTGDTAETLQVTASQLGIGTHKIWAEVAVDQCIASDTILITVIPNPGISEEEARSKKIIPESN